jgi:tetratricopeptide (TPR) repeat protein
VELAERALERDKKPWVFHAAGLAHYRAGQYEQAIDRFEESLKDPGWQQGAGHASELGLALAHHRMGHAKEARQWLDKADQWYEKAVQDALASPTGRATLQWWKDWPIFVVLRREARKLILGKDLLDDPRLKELTDRIRDWLGKRDKATADYDVALFLQPNESRLWLARAWRLAELKRTKEAEADFAKAVELKPDDGELRMERGRLYFELGQTDKAAADFRKAVALLDDKALEPLLSESAGPETAEPLARLADDAVLQRLTTDLSRTPEDASKLWQRGAWHVRHRRWKEATADFTTALQREPTKDSWWWLHAAPVLVATGDEEGYRRLCRDMLHRFGETQVAYVADVTAKTNLLLPASGKDMDLACRLADQSVLLGKSQSGAHHWFIFCKGLADYRRGNASAAIAGLDPLLRQSASLPELIAQCHLILAMAHHRQGEAKAAREHLARAVKLLDQYLSEPTLFPNGPGGYSYDWLIAWLLHRKARTLIEGEKAGPQR